MRSKHLILLRKHTALIVEKTDFSTAQACKKISEEEGKTDDININVTGTKEDQWWNINGWRRGKWFIWESNQSRNLVQYFVDIVDNTCCFTLNWTLQDSSLIKASALHSISDSLNLLQMWISVWSTTTPSTGHWEHCFITDLSYILQKTYSRHFYLFWCFGFTSVLLCVHTKCNAEINCMSHDQWFKHRPWLDNASCVFAHMFLYISVDKIDKKSSTSPV